MNVKLGKNYEHMKKTLFSLLTLLFIFSTVSAQTIPDSTKTDASLSGQYQFLLSKSRTLEGYKLINPFRLSQFWKNVRDSLNHTQRQFISIKKTQITYQTEIAGLKKKVEETKTFLDSSNTKLDQISFIGIGFTKSAYNLLVWGLITVLALSLVVVILRSAKNIREAKYRSALYEEINQEYQNFKVKSNEKEKKLARELQDERNKLDEIKNNGR
ncbi:MAG: hypothetical protein V4594_18050 [Bacteroidota bacterium]